MVKNRVSHLYWQNLLNYLYPTPTSKKEFKKNNTAVEYRIVL